MVFDVGVTEIVFSIGIGYALLGKKDLVRLSRTGGTLLGRATAHGTLAKEQLAKAAGSAEVPTLRAELRASMRELDQVRRELGTLSATAVFYDASRPAPFEDAPLPAAAAAAPPPSAAAPPLPFDPLPSAAAAAAGYSTPYVVRSDAAAAAAAAPPHDPGAAGRLARLALAEMGLRGRDGIPAAAQEASGADALDRVLMEMLTNDTVERHGLAGPLQPEETEARAGGSER